MKKLYVEPTLKMVKIGGQRLLDGSITFGPGEKDQGADNESKAFTGGIEFDDDEDSGSSPWE